MLNELKIVLKPLLLFFVVVIGGAYILSSIEGLEIGDSLYRTFLLVATVTEYPVTTMSGKIISSILVVVGLGLILYMATTTTATLLKMSTRIRRRKKKDLK